MRKTIFALLRCFVSSLATSMSFISGMEDEVVGTVSDGWALLEAAARLQPDIVT